MARKRPDDLQLRTWTDRRARTVEHGFIAATHALSAAARQLPMARLDRHQVERTSNLSYGPHPAHRLDVYRPQGRRSPLPVILYAHGGAFQNLSKDTHWLMALLWARAGYLVLNVDYRLAPEHRFPAAPADVARALEWARGHARDYGGDPDRILLTGESAGANLVTTVSIATAYRRPEPWARDLFDTGIRPLACIPTCGMFDVHGVDRFVRQGTYAWIQMHMRGIEARYAPGDPDDPALALASPLRVLERAEAPARSLPPFMTLVGTRDPIRSDTYRLNAALARLGVPCETRTYVGEIHAFHGYQLWRAQARQAWQHQYDFARRVLEGRYGAPTGAPTGAG